MPLVLRKFALPGLVLFAASAAALWTMVARANLLSDGSFETPVVPVGSFTNFTGAVAVGDWTGGAGGQVSIVSGAFTQGGLNFVAQDGAQWLDLTGFNANSPNDSVRQTVATTIGT